MDWSWQFHVRANYVNRVLEQWTFIIHANCQKTSSFAAVQLSDVEFYVYPDVWQSKSCRRESIHTCRTMQTAAISSYRSWTDILDHIPMHSKKGHTNCSTTTESHESRVYIRPLLIISIQKTDKLPSIWMLDRCWRNNVKYFGQSDWQAQKRYSAKADSPRDCCHVRNGQRNQIHHRKWRGATKLVSDWYQSLRCFSLTRHTNANIGAPWWMVFMRTVSPPTLIFSG